MTVGSTKAKGHRVLIVDDEEAICFALRVYFAAKGFEVDAARELEEAQALVVCRDYSLVVADLRLTDIRGVEGLELVSFIRQRSPDTRVILLTAYGSPGIIAEAERVGVDAFLHKPQPLAKVAGIAAALLGVSA